MVNKLTNIWRRVRWSISTAHAQIWRDEIWWINYLNYVWGIPKCLQVRKSEGWFSFILISTKYWPMLTQLTGSRECTQKWTPHNFLACTFFSFQQECFTSGNTWDKASNVKNRTKTLYDVKHVGRGMPSKVSYRPPDMIDHRTLDDIK